MQEFFKIAKADFLQTFGGAFLFPVLLLCIIWIFRREKDWMKKILLCILPLVFLFLYWCPLTGLLFMKLLGENVYWRISGKGVLSEEWFEPSLNAYKIPQNVIDVCEVLPSNIHAMVSNRLMPYIRMYDPTITLEYGRNSLGYNGITETESLEQILYLEAQKSEIDLSILAPLAKEAGCAFLVFSNNRTYIGDWADYGYREYGNTDEFVIFADEDYE